jgi:fatty acid desaturase
MKTENQNQRPQTDASPQTDAGTRSDAALHRATSEPPTERPRQAPTNARQARKRHERQLIALAIGVLVLVGGALIALVYGPIALLTALPFLLVGAGAILILYLLFLLAERWVERQG